MAPHFLTCSLLVFIVYATGASYGNDFLPCENDIYCYGDIIYTVNRAQLFPDSKTFVDMRLKYPPYIVRSNYRYMIAKYGPAPSKEIVRAFVDHNFDPPGLEFESWVPTDWVEQPEAFNKIRDQSLKTYATQLNAFWEQLGRKIKPDVHIRNDMYSMIYVNNPLIVPGGRFIEFYYWDQFWILKGLLHGEMTMTVRGMLENFLQMVEKLGYIPNGGRIYYRRSHPPLLIPMMRDYLEHTSNWTFIEKHIGTLEKEFNFWMTERTHIVNISGTAYNVSRYNVERGNPRPEAYNPDYDLTATLTDNDAKNELYMHLKTAAESGLDFSSRWFIPENLTTVGVLRDIKTRFVMPVDLNVLICRNARILSQFFAGLNNTDKADFYSNLGDQWEDTINKVFWNETEGSWFDYLDYGSIQGHKTEFYPGNILPLILNVTSMSSKIDKVISYLEGTKVLTFPGGIPSSLEQTGEQWDFPNGWAPHVHWFIESLEGSGDEKALQIAKETAQKWVTNNYLTYTKHNNTMFEKYDVMNIGSAGGGGEYEVVIGFGWSNGAVMDLMVKFGDYLKIETKGGGDGGDGDGAGFVVASFHTVVIALLLSYVRNVFGD